MLIPKKEKTTNITLGNNYDINKQLVQKYEKKLTDEQLNKKKEIIANFVNNSTDYYFMLLCNEKKDYTVFEFTEGKKWTERCADLAKCLVDECLINRGEIRGIDLTEDKQAIEIWLSIDGESFVYYFFPYEKGVIIDF